MATELEKLARQFRDSGNDDIAQGVDAWASVAKSRGLDTFQTTTVEIEAPQIQRFSDEAREALEAKGFKIYELKGQSIKTLRYQKDRFMSIWYQIYPEIDALASRRSEVAIDPNDLFIKDSYNKTFEQQLEVVSKYSEGLSIPGVQAILGEVPDYIELAFAHLAKTGQSLFGEKYDFDYTRTQTRDGSLIATVGHLEQDGSLYVGGTFPDFSSYYMYAAPLIVPVLGTK